MLKGRKCSGLGRTTHELDPPAGFGLQTARYLSRPLSEFAPDTKPKSEIAVDELGRLRKTRVNKALDDFDENLRSQVISVLEQLHAIA